MANSAPGIQTNKNASGDIISLSNSGKTIKLPTTGPQRPLLFLGDSLTWGGTLRAPDPQGRPWFLNTTCVKTNLGGTTWLLFMLMDGRAPISTTGVIDTDGNGKIRWTVDGDPTPGPWVDVLLGGFYNLSSGTSPYQLQIVVRAKTAALTIPTVPGSGAVTTPSGIATVINHDLMGYSAWVAGQLGEAFSDYINFGISGDNSENLLIRTPQALAYGDFSAVVILIGTNDNVSTPAMVSASFSNIKKTIDLCLAKPGVERVYVGEIFPRKDSTVAVSRYSGLLSAQVQAYCKTKQGVRFWLTTEALSDPTALPITLMSGAYHTDNLHLNPFGAYRAAIDLVKSISYDYMPERVRKGYVDLYDSTLQLGAWNANPNLKGTAGTVVANNGVTGTCPDSWNISRIATTQTCATSFENDVNGGSWFTMTVANAGAVDYHTIAQTVNIPAEVPVGGYFRMVTAFKIFNATNISVFQANALSNFNNVGPYTFWINRNINWSGPDGPELVLMSSPVQKIAGMTSVTLTFRVGGAAGSSGKIGCKALYVETIK